MSTILPVLNGPVVCFKKKSAGTAPAPALPKTGTTGTFTKSYRKKVMDYWTGSFSAGELMIDAYDAGVIYLGA